MKISKAESAVANQIIEMMGKNDLPPWRKPWNGSQSLPHNATTGRRYGGMNMWALMLAPHSDPRYITIRNAGKRGLRLKPEWQEKWDSKEFRGYTVLFWNWPTPAERLNGKAPYCRMYWVFNLEMFDGVDDAKGIKALEDLETFEHGSIESAQKIVSGYKTIPKIETGGDRAAYSPAMDRVCMPKKEHFPKLEEYYSTLFHELAHSTGHEDRLSREGVTNIVSFGSHSYSQEELVAEFTAAMLCGEAGIAPETLENSAAYLKSWHKRLKNDPDMLVLALRQANKARDYILDKKYEN